MKAPVGLLSDRTVLRSEMEGLCPDKFQFAVLVSSRVWGRHAPTRTLQKRGSVAEVQSRKGTTFSRIENLWPRDGSCPLRFPEFLKFHFSICLQIVDKLRLIRYDKSKQDTQPRRCNHDRRDLRPLFF